MDEIPEEDYPMIEEIILWSTIFEDRDIFKDKLKRNYGDRLTDEQIKKIVRKRFTGWGRLSRKLLTEIKVDSDNGPVTIMDVLREGNPNHSGRSLGKPMVFMEVLRDDDLGFQERIDVINREYMLGATALALEDLPAHLRFAVASTRHSPSSRKSCISPDTRPKTSLSRSRAKMTRRSAASGQNADMMHSKRQWLL